jgi:hypothetical protein
MATNKVTVVNRLAPPGQVLSRAALRTRRLFSLSAAALEPWSSGAIDRVFDIRAQLYNSRLDRVVHKLVMPVDDLAIR